MTRWWPGMVRSVLTLYMFSSPEPMISDSSSSSGCGVDDLAGLEAPHLLAGLVEAVEDVVGGAGVDRAVGRDGRGGEDPLAGLEGPRLRPGSSPGRSDAPVLRRSWAHRGPVGAGLGLGLRGGGLLGAVPHATEPAVIAITVAAAAMSLTWARVVLNGWRTPRCGASVRDFGRSRSVSDHMGEVSVGGVGAQPSRRSVADFGRSRSVSDHMWAKSVRQPAGRWRRCRSTLPCGQDRRGAQVGGTWT